MWQKLSTRTRQILFDSGFSFNVRRIGLFLFFVSLVVPRTVLGQPFNDNWNANGSELAFPFATTGNNINATIQGGEQNLFAPPTGSTVWWFFTAPSTGSVTINTNGSNFDTVLHVFTDFQNGFGNFTLVGFDDDGGDGLQSQLTFPVIAGQCYEVRVGGFNGAQGIIALSAPPENDNYGDSIFTGLPFMTTGNNIGATTQPGEQQLISTGATVWWHVFPPGNGVVTVDTFGSDYDTQLHIYTGFPAPLDLLTPVANNDDSGGTFQSQVSFPVNAGQCYDVRVGGFDNAFPSQGNILLSATFHPGGVLLGDVNLDGIVNLLDVQPFVSLLTGGGYQAEADINQDGFVNLTDVNPFVAILTGG